jgi:molybdopterin-binding protein
MGRASWLWLFALVAAAPAAWADELEPVAPPPPSIDEPVTAPLPKAAHPNPRLKLSYVRSAIGNLDGSAVPLDALAVDAYPLSRRWARVGLGLETGRGSATFMGDRASLVDLLLGVSAGVQLPGRVTPFVEGHLAGGALHGQTDGPITVDGVVVTSAAATTYLYTFGLDAGAEVYAVGRSYLSLSLGWLHTTWRGATDAAPPGASAPDIALTDIAHDALLFKAGVGI